METILLLVATVHLIGIKASMQDTASSYLLSPLVFDALFYINDNPDIMFADVLTKEKAELHWLSLGAEEGRQGCGSFHSKQYLQRYPDLKKKFGLNYTKAIEHFVMTGHSEHKKGYVECGFPTPFGKRWTISNDHIFISASERMGAGIDSLVWNNKQFLSAHDHGRGLQMKATMHLIGECYKPTEMGGRDDRAWSTTQVMSVQTYGQTLQTKVYPAFWLRPGSHQVAGSGCPPGSPALNHNITYSYPFEKKVTLSCAGSMNCIEYTSTFTIGGHWPDGDNQIELQAPAVFLAGNMTRIWRFDTRTLTFHNHFSQESHSAIAVGTDDGDYVTGVYFPPGQDNVNHQFYGTHSPNKPAAGREFPGSFSMFNVFITTRKPAHEEAYTFTLRKLAHALYRDFYSCKNEKHKQKNFDIFLIFAQNIDCGYTLEPPRRGGSNEYPQSMFLSKNKKNRYTPANPSFTV